MSDNHIDNLLRLLNTDRRKEAVEQHRDDKVAMTAFLDICRRIEEGETFLHHGGCFNSDCQWNGIDRRCNCGNRRVYWLWEHGFWKPEPY